MGLDLTIQYPGKINDSDPGYPYGAAQNITTPGDGTGTPWEQAIVNDFLGYQQALLVQSGLTPSGNPDTALDSQYRDAAEILAGRGLVQVVSGNHFIADTDKVVHVLVITGTNDLDLFLPSVLTNPGRNVIVKKIDAAAGTVTIKTESDSVTIDGVPGLTGVVVDTQYGGVNLFEGNGNWNQASAVVAVATPTKAGIISTEAQSFGGSKTFAETTTVDDLVVTGSTTGVTASAAANNWANSTAYGLNQLVVDGNSGLQYRAANAHTSPASGNLTDDLANWSVIGSASNGVIVSEWSDPEDYEFIAGEIANPGWGTPRFREVRWRRVGENAEIKFDFAQTSSGSNGNGTYYFVMPPSLAGLTYDQSKYANNVNTSLRNNVLGEFSAYDNANAAFGSGLARYDYPSNRIYFTVMPDSNGNQDIWNSGGRPTFNASGLEVSARFTIAIAEWANSGTTVAVQDLTEKTKIVDNTVLSMSGGVPGFSSPVVTGLSYRDSLGNYRLKVSGKFQFSLGTTISGTVSIAGCKPRFSQKQPVDLNIDLNTVHVIGNTATSDNGTFFQITSAIISGSAQSNECFFSLDCELEEKPAWFDANRENPASVSAYIPAFPRISMDISGGGTQNPGTDFPYTVVRPDVPVIGDWSPSGGGVTVPETGMYCVEFSIGSTSPLSSREFEVAVDGNVVKEINRTGSSGPNMLRANTTMYLEAGQVVSIRHGGAAFTIEYPGATGQYNDFTLSKLSV